MRKSLLSGLFLVGIVLAWVGLACAALPYAYFSSKKYQEIPTGSVGAQTVTIKLSSKCASPVMVNITASGSATDIDSPVYGETPVAGSYYELSANSVTFNPGETSKTVTLTTKCRKTLDNLYIPFYRVYLTLALSAADGCKDKIRVDSVGNKMTVKLVDDVTTVVKNIRDYGAKGDGSADDTAAFQACRDAVAALINPVSQYGIVYIPPGTYRIKGPIKESPGCSWVGENRTNTIIKRWTRAEYETAQGFTFDSKTRYWLTMFYYNMVAKPWNSTSDSSLSCYRNITFDGNGRNFTFASYLQFEPSMMISTRVLTTAGQPGRLRTLIENCHFYDNITSDLSLCQNTDTRIYNCLFTPNQNVIKKGDIGLSQANITLHCNKCSGSRQIDIEQNTTTEGYYADSRFDYHFDNCILGHLQGGASTVTGTQIVTAINTTFHNMGILMASADVTLTDCTVNCDAYGSAENTCIRSCKSFLADGCTFNINPPAKGIAGVALQFTNMTDANVVEFKDCIFNKGSGTFPDVCTALTKQLGHYSQTANKGLLKLTNCTFNGAFDYCYQNYIGDNLIVNGMTVNGPAAAFYLNGRDLGTYPLLAQISGPIHSNAPIYLKAIANYSGLNCQVKNVMSGTSAVELTKDNSEIVSSGSYISGWNFDLEGNSSRKITGIGDPPRTGLKGDIYTNGTDIWDCMVTGYKNYSGTYYDATWVRR